MANINSKIINLAIFSPRWYIPRNHNVVPPREDSKSNDNFKGRIIFMSMYNDFEWKAEGNKEPCECNSQTAANCACKLPRGHWSFLGSGLEEKWYGTYTDKPDGSWDRMAEEMMLNFSGSCHPTFRASSAF